MYIAWVGPAGVRYLTDTRYSPLRGRAGTAADRGGGWVLLDAAAVAALRALRPDEDWRIVDAGDGPHIHFDTERYQVLPAGEMREGDGRQEGLADSR